MIRKTVLDDRSGNAETSLAEFHCCSQHGQISTFNRTETGSAREIRRRDADVLKYAGSAHRITYIVECEIYTVSRKTSHL